MHHCIKLIQQSAAIDESNESQYDTIIKYWRNIYNTEEIFTNLLCILDAEELSDFRQSKW